jgi:hypothetical protein
MSDIKCIKCNDFITLYNNSDKNNLSFDLLDTRNKHCYNCWKNKYLEYNKTLLLNINNFNESIQFYRIEPTYENQNIKCSQVAWNELFYTKYSYNNLTYMTNKDSIKNKYKNKVEVLFGLDELLYFIENIFDNIQTCNSLTYIINEYINHVSRLTKIIDNEKIIIGICGSNSIYYLLEIKSKMISNLLFKFIL